MSHPTCTPLGCGISKCDAHSITAAAPAAATTACRQSSEEYSVRGPSHVHTRNNSKHRPYGDCWAAGLLIQSREPPAGEATGIVNNAGMSRVVVNTRISMIHAVLGATERGYGRTHRHTEGEKREKEEREPQTHTKMADMMGTSTHLPSVTAVSVDTLFLVVMVCLLVEVSGNTSQIIQ